MFKYQCCGIELDFSRQRLSADEFVSLINIARDKKVLSAFKAMCSGAIVNISENRAALHVELRADKSKDVKNTLERMYAFAEQVRNGQWTGSKGHRITDVINIGIGGSDMGPRAVYHALRKPKQNIRVHFLAAVDGIALQRIVETLNPLSTLVVVSSKSFSTQETLTNLAAVEEWLADAGISKDERKSHIVVSSANQRASEILDLPESNYFPFWEWVGGRFSVWSSVGLPLVIALGVETFKEFLAGAQAMDNHALIAPLEENLPALIALLSYRNSVNLSISSHCFLPYDERLRVFGFWLQQLEMESLGKNKHLDGTHVTGMTGQCVWGGHGNESQHSFYQWLREGTTNNSIALCWCKKAGHPFDKLHRILIANAIAQAEALTTRESNMPYFNVITTLVIEELTPFTLGALMSMYEHKTVMLGTLYDINPFDQPGVELGKKLANQLGTM